MSLSEAVRRGLIRSNPCTSLVLPRPAGEGLVVEDEGTPTVWDQEQLHLFLERTKESEWYPLWYLLLNTGMRPGEACGLQWSDLSATGELNIQRSIKSDGRKGWIVGLPKTRKSRRTIALPEGTLRVLRQHRQGQLSGYVFSPRSMKVREPVRAFITPTQMHVAWARDLERARIGDSRIPLLSLYGTRHVHATLLLSLGVNVKVVSERLGHTGIQITLDTYSHVLPHLQTEAADKLRAVFGG